MSGSTVLAQVLAMAGDSNSMTKGMDDMMMTSAHVSDLDYHIWNMHALSMGLLIIRAIVGITIATHGLNKIFGGGRIKGTAGWFASIGMKMPLANAWMAALTEIGAGLMLTLGLLTPLAAGALIAVMMVAMITSHIRNGWFIFKANGGGIEYVVVLALVCLGIAISGPGEWSLDDSLKIYWIGATGAIIALVAGIGGSALQLAAFWRPKKPAEA